MLITLSIDMQKVRVGPEDTYDDSIDDIGAILADLCAHLSDHAAARFSVKGFGDECWPVDVYTDLAVFLEQLPYVTKMLESQQEVTLEFYEQGVERNIIMKPMKQVVKLGCVSFTAWQPIWPNEEIAWQDLMLMLEKIRAEFVSYVESVSPPIFRHPWFQQWSDSSHGGFVT